MFVAVTSLCWALRGHRLEGGDTALFLKKEWVGLIAGPVWTFYFREPLSFLCPQIVYRLTEDRGWPLEDVYAVSSCVAGGLFAVVLLAFSRHPIFWVIMLGNTTTFLFFGHIENYALAFTVSVAALMLGWRCAVGLSRRMWPTVACWCLAIALHQATAFLAPAALALMLRREGGRWRLVARERRDVQLCLLAIIALCLFIVVPTVLSALEMIPVIIYGTTGNPWEYINPLTEQMDDWITENSQLGSWARYTMFSAAHWRQMLIFQVALCPLGLISLAIMLRRRRGRGEAFLALACGSMLLWSLVWHPHMGWQDWDLWSFMAAPMNLTAAMLWSGRLRELESA